jgi:hypothetical protein
LGVIGTILLGVATWQFMIFTKVLDTNEWIGREIRTGTTPDSPIRLEYQVGSGKNPLGKNSKVA